MPSTYAHFCFGREVLAALPQEMQSLLWPEQNLFSIGLHGPDILFFDHPLLGRVSRLGHRMHKQSGAAFFRPAGEKLAALEFPAPETAYLYGFLCHFALDRACHGTHYPTHARPLLTGRPGPASRMPRRSWLTHSIAARQAVCITAGQRSARRIAGVPGHEYVSQLRLGPRAGRSATPESALASGRPIDAPACTRQSTAGHVGRPALSGPPQSRGGRARRRKSSTSAM